MKVYNPVKSLLKSEYFEKAYSTKRIMYFSVSKVLVPPMRRWRGWFTKKNPSSSRNISARSRHYIQFISDTLDILEEPPNIKGFHILIDNAPIYVPEVIDPAIIGLGYTHISPSIFPWTQSYWSVMDSVILCTTHWDLFFDSS